jgi:hypothetical protein
VAAQPSKLINSAGHYYKTPAAHLAAEVVFRQGLDQLRLPHARRPHKQERRDGPPRVAQAAARARERGGDGVHRVGLPNDAVVQG